jgi:hypothetical protein
MVRQFQRITAADLNHIPKLLMSRPLKRLASIGLVLGAVFGMAGTFAPTASLRGLAWGIDGVSLVMASALLTVGYLRVGQEVVAAGFLVFAVGEGLVVSGAAMDLAASTPSFGAGAALWAVALALISAPRVFPAVARLLGFATSLLFMVTALRIFAGAPILPTSSPLPFAIYPLFVATLGAWTWTLLRREP